MIAQRVSKSLLAAHFYFGSAVIPFVHRDLFIDVSHYLEVSEVLCAYVRGRLIIDEALIFLLLHIFIPLGRNLFT